MKCYCGDIRIVIVRNGFEIPFMLELRLRLLGIQLNANIGDFKAILGFCDVSALETQFLNENIEKTDEANETMSNNGLEDKNIEKGEE